MVNYKGEVFEAKIVGASHNEWYKELIGSKVNVIKFTHNYYRDANIPVRTYNVQDVKLIKEIK